MQHDFGGVPEGAIPVQSGFLKDVGKEKGESIETSFFILFFWFQTLLPAWSTTNSISKPAKSSGAPSSRLPLKETSGVATLQLGLGSSSRLPAGRRKPPEWKNLVDIVDE